MDRQRNPEKRTLGSGGGICKQDWLTQRMEKIQESRRLRIERTRVTADRVAASALNSLKRKQRIMECLGLCGCNNPSTLELDELAAKKRDVEISSSSASASSVDTSVSAAGASIDTSVKTASATDVKIDSGLGSSSSSIGSSISSDLHFGGLGLGGGGGAKGGLYKYLIACEDYEKRMIMNMAIEDAANMIRRLAYETRGGSVCGEDPNFEKKCLKLAIDLVNKVTYDSSSSVDLLSKYRYNSVDEYIKAASVYRGRQADSEWEMYAEEPYPCACSEYDIATGNACPVCMARGFGLAPMYSR